MGFVDLARNVWQCKLLKKNKSHICKNREDVPEEILNREREYLIPNKLREQESGDVVEKIAEGKLDKFSKKIVKWKNRLI